MWFLPSLPQRCPSPGLLCNKSEEKTVKSHALIWYLIVSIKVHVLQTDLLSFSFALKHKHAEGGLDPRLRRSSRSPAEQTPSACCSPDGRQTSHVLQLELTNTHNWDASAVHVGLINTSTLTLILVTCVCGSINLLTDTKQFWASCKYVKQSLVQRWAGRRTWCSYWWPSGGIRGFEDVVNCTSGENLPHGFIITSCVWPARTASNPRTARQTPAAGANRGYLTQNTRKKRSYILQKEKPILGA